MKRYFPHRTRLSQRSIFHNWDMESSNFAYCAFLSPRGRGLLPCCLHKDELQLATPACLEENTFSFSTPSTAYFWAGKGGITPSKVLYKSLSGGVVSIWNRMNSIPVLGLHTTWLTPTPMKLGLYLREHIHPERMEDGRAAGNSTSKEGLPGGGEAIISLRLNAQFAHLLFILFNSRTRKLRIRSDSTN
ncbi:hypothetical protein ARMSODRAFT_693182 [Armillaria solidipes]|uniref:Uncharacterized protein n=1 Tax=Armillaria solidipes TaxID=1076256 RepID=A0A2H3BP57_9AGAR|nr:hypothetical protein ARMSODRAFT_693182 [Armillaria solidipes]